MTVLHSLANQPDRSYPKSKQLVNATDSPNTNKKKLRKQIIERDGDWCLLCGRPKGGLQIHRVIYGSQGGLYVLENCVQLCIYCHNPIVHKDKKKWQPRLLFYIKNHRKNWEEIA